MLGSPLKSHERAPRYHEDRLVVKMAPASLAAGARSLTAGAAMMASNPGISTLDRMDKGGMILRVTNLDAVDPLPRVIAPRTAAARLMAAAPPGQPQAQPATGLRLIKATKGTDLSQLQAALMDDPSIELVSRVPVRYLTAKKKATTRSRGRKRNAAKRAAMTGSNARTGVGIAATPPNPLTMWNLQKIMWQAARDTGFDQASSVRVSVLDTGIDLGHPDLPGSAIDYTHDFGAVDARASDRDIVGHGTHVSGTIRALTNGSHGINGICDCQLAAYKIFDDEADRSDMQDGWEVFEYFVDPEMYLAALVRCSVDGTRVINLSIGGYGAPSGAEQLLFQDLIDRNVCVVAAMGNDDTFTSSYPAAIPGVIAVGASRINDARARFSNKGSHISLIAPGEDIWSTLPTYAGDFGYLRNPTTGQVVRNARELDYDAWPGTSMATPHVTAAIALMLGKDGSLSLDDVRQLLEANCDKVPGMNGSDFDQFHGYGRLNLSKVAAAV